MAERNVHAPIVHLLQGFVSTGEEKAGATFATVRAIVQTAMSQTTDHPATGSVNSMVNKKGGSHFCLVVSTLPPWISLLFQEFPL